MVKRRDRCDERTGEEDGDNSGGKPIGSMYRRRRGTFPNVQIF